MIQIIINAVISESRKLYDFTVKSNGDYICGGICSGVQILKAAHGHIGYLLYRADFAGIQHHIVTCEDAVVVLGKDVPETVIEDFTVSDEKEKARMNTYHGKVIS